MQQKHQNVQIGSYRGVIKREAVYKCTNKDYLPEAQPRANDHFTCEAKPSKGKMHCPRAQRVQARHLLARINCRALNKPPLIRRAINIFLLDAKNLFIYAARCKIHTKMNLFSKSSFFYITSIESSFSSQSYSRSNLELKSIHSDQLKVAECQLML